MAAQIGLKIESGGDVWDAHLKSMAFICSDLIEQMLTTVDIMVYDPQTKTLKSVRLSSINGDAVQLTVE